MRRRKGQAGFSVVEVMFCVVLLGIVALGLSNASVIAIRANNISAHNSIAAQLAIERLEEFASSDPAFIVADTTLSETSIVRDGRAFDRTTSIIINPDRSRTVTVTVDSVALEDGGRTTISNTFAL